MNTPAFLPLVSFERRFQHDHSKEHALLIDHLGNPILERDGGQDSVEFSPDELEKARGGLISHSHPKALPPSGADLMLAAEYGLTLRAVGVAPDTGQTYHYAVQMPSGGKAYAQAIASVYDDTLEQAEQELASQPYPDLQWQREARHLATKRLAKRFGFHYQRDRKEISVSEMKSRDQRQHEDGRLALLASVRPALKTEIFEPLHASLLRVLQHYSMGENIPVGALPAVRREMTALVQKTILGVPDRNGTLVPYEVRQGQVIPHSTYFALLWNLMFNAASHAVSRHAQQMRRLLPDDLIRAYGMATLSPFDQLSETTQADPFDMLAEGPDGRRLSDRIWNIAGDLRRKLDMYLTQAIARGESVPNMARELEGYLQIRQMSLFPDTPYANMSYEALRLARTETAIAYAKADYAAALQNPFVEKYQPFTSPDHNCSDQCDIEEANGPYDKSDMGHLVPYHANCQCGMFWLEVERVQTVIDTLRAQVEQGLVNMRSSIVDKIGPLSKQFIELLFKVRK